MSNKLLAWLILKLGGKDVKDFLLRLNTFLTGGRTTILLWISYLTTIIPWVQDTLNSVTNAGADAGMLVAAIISSVKTLLTIIAKIKAAQPA